MQVTPVTIIPSLESWQLRLTRVNFGNLFLRSGAGPAGGPVSCAYHADTVLLVDWPKQHQRGDRGALRVSEIPLRSRTRAALISRITSGRFGSIRKAEELSITKHSRSDTLKSPSAFSEEATSFFRTTSSVHYASPIEHGIHVCGGAAGRRLLDRTSMLDLNSSKVRFVPAKTNITA